MRTSLFFLPLMLFTASTAFTQNIELVVPIDGTHGVDYFITRYHDTAPSDTLFDYQCGWKTNYGSEGTEFAIRNYAQMDSGVRVLAAADGVVFSLEDEIVGRNRDYDESLGYGNYVGIEHEGGWITYYGSLKKGSILVDIGDSVSAGMHIAEVGASSEYVGPFLFFDLLDDNYDPYDPFGDGPCAESPSLWLDPPLYRTSFSVIDFLLLDHVIQFGDYFEFASSSEEFASSSEEFAYPDSVVNLWVQVENLLEGDLMVFSWERHEDGTLYFVYEFEPQEYNASIYYAWSWTRLPPEGEYVASFSVNYEEKLRQEFTVGEISGVVSDLGPSEVGLSVRHLPGQRNMFLVSTLDDGIAQNVSAQIFDIRGNLVAEPLTNQRISSSTIFDLSRYSLPGGSYVLQILHAGRTFVVPIALYE